MPTQFRYTCVRRRSFALTRARVVEWQTRGSQKPLGETPCEFDPRLGHHISAQSEPPD